MNAYDLLGQQMVNEVMGQAPPAKPGFDAQFGINAAAELLSRGIATHENKQAAQKAAAESKAAGDRAIQADVSWANAEIMLETANLSKDPQKILSAQALVQSAQQNAINASYGLPTDALARRISTANDMAKKAAEASYEDSGNAGKAAAMRAWAKISAAVSAFAAQSPGGALALQQVGRGSSFLDFMKRKYGGVPVWGWTVGGLGVATGLSLVIRAMRK